MLKFAGRRPHRALKDIVDAGRAVWKSACSALNTHDPEAAFHLRHFASQNTYVEPPVLKKVLRELYKRVHPDLFHDVPHAREANEHSFKLLQVHSDTVARSFL